MVPQMTTPVEEDAALLVVDVQVGFCPGGNLPVPAGDEVVPVANEWVETFRESGRPIAFSRDWHPPDHVSFKERGGIWPPHCVVGTKDAEFHPDLVVPDGALVVSKAKERDEEAYSAFQGTDLAETLKTQGVRTLYVLGLATDYCVRASALDAMDAGFRVKVVRDGVAAVDVNPGDGKRALEEMREKGAELV